MSRDIERRYLALAKTPIQSMLRESFDHEFDDARSTPA
jgi:hypothetical protein